MTGRRNKPYVADGPRSVVTDDESESGTQAMLLGAQSTLLGFAAAAVAPGLREVGGSLVLVGTLVVAGVARGRPL